MIQKSGKFKYSNGGLVSDFLYQEYSLKFGKSATVVFLRTWKQIPLLNKLLAGIPDDVDVYIVVCCHGQAILPNDCFSKRVNACLIYSEPMFRGKVFGLNAGISFALSKKCYKDIYVSMVDLVVTKDGYDNLRKSLYSENAGITAPLVITEGTQSSDGQWPGMGRQYVFHFEFISFMAKTELLEKVLPDPNYVTAWANCFEFPLRVWEAGYSIFKCANVIGNHAGGATNGVGLPGDRFKDREAYRRAGRTELQEWLRRNNNDFASLMKRVAEVSNNKLLNMETISRYYAWFSYQMFHVSKYRIPSIKNTAQNKGKPRVAMVFHSLYQGGIEKLWAEYGKILEKNGYDVYYLYWDMEHRVVNESFRGMKVMHVGAHKPPYTIKWMLEALRIDCFIYYSNLHKNFFSSLPIPSLEYIANIKDCLTCNQKQELLSESISSKQYIKSKNNFNYVPQPIYIERASFNKTKTIVRVGRLIPAKGFDFFAEIAKALPNYKFIWVGGVDRKSPFTLEDIKKKYPHVEWVGNIADRNIVMDYIGQASCTLHPVINAKEGISNAVLESISVGTPSICSNNGFLPEIVTKDTGYLVDGLDVDRWVEVIKECISIPPKKWKESCSKFAETRTTSATEAALLVAIKSALTGKVKQ